MRLFQLTGIGIDVGTVNARLAMVEARAPARLLEDAGGSPCFPAVVCFEPDRFLVGRAALGRAWASARWLSRASKRLVGLGIDHPVVGRHARRTCIRKNARGELVLGEEGSSATPDRTLTNLLGHLASLAAAELGRWPAGVVLCEPGWFEQRQRVALLDAAKAAGLGAATVVPEPVAAVADLAAGAATELVAVVDAGGGGVTVAVMRIAKERIELLGCAADGEVGGEEVDAALVDRALERLRPARDLDDVTLFELLRQSCEQIKRDLGDAPVATRPLDFLRRAGESAPLLVLDRSDLESALTGLVWRVEECCTRALRAAAVEAGKLDRAIALGGLTRIATVRARIERALGQRPWPGPGADSAVAAGAARISASRQGTAPPIVIEDGSWCGGCEQDTDDEPPASSESSESQPTPEIRGEQPIAETHGEHPIPEIRGEHPIPEIRDEQPGFVILPTAMSSQEPSAAPSRPEPARPVMPTKAQRSSAPSRGRFFNPEGSAGLLRLALSRPLEAADLDPVALPVLLMRILARKDVTGTLTLSAAADTATLYIFEGVARATARDHATFVEAFSWPEGCYELVREKPRSLPPDKFGLARIVVDGLRSVIRELERSDVDEALASRLHLCPLFRPDRQRLLGKLNRFESGLARHGLDGTNPGHDLVAHGGASPDTMSRLLLLCSVLGALDWRAYEPPSGETLVMRLERQLVRLEQSNHFEALGIHWSAASSDVEAAYQALRARTAPGGEWALAAPEICHALRARYDAAYAVLRDPRQRVTHRREAYPDMDVEATTDLLDQRARALSLRAGDKSAASDERGTREVWTELGGAVRSKKPKQE